MKNFYIAVMIEENGKHYAHMIRVTDSTNLHSRLSGIQNIIAANIMPTKKAAAATVTAWNESFKNNGTYLFDDGPLF